MDIEKDKLPKGLPPELFDDTPLIPTKVFDNLYCIGTRSVVAWLIDTTEGYILIDALWDDHDGELIIQGMESLGLNPKDLKYNIITHGHGDHYGGANYLKEMLNTKVFMSEVDCKFMMEMNVGANGPRSPKVVVDAFVKDQDEIHLGNTNITIIETPGHTPGGLSLVFPVYYNKTRYMAGIWGGTALPRNKEALIQYQESLYRFRQVVEEQNIEIEVTAHLFEGNGYDKLEKVRKLSQEDLNQEDLNQEDLNQEDLNPFIIGVRGFTERLELLNKRVCDALE